ncbi:MAG: hypothetical protein ACI841_000107 [Planctomycetota bacterium]|jgi:hypothetical protein
MKIQSASRYILSITALCSGACTSIPEFLEIGQVIRNDMLIAEVDGEVLRLRSADTGFAFAPAIRFPWGVTAVEGSRIEDSVWGRGELLTLTHTGSWISKIAIYEDSPFAHLSTRVVNNGPLPFATRSMAHVEMDLDCGVPVSAARMLGTGGLTTVDEAGGSYTFSALADPESRNGVVCGWLTHERGTGVFFPGIEQDTARIRTQIDFGNYRVEPGAERETETLLIGWFDDARLGLESYADSVAADAAIEFGAKPGVYCTWYHSGASDQESLAKNTTTAAAELAPFGLSVMQIDDLWQSILPDDTTLKIEPASIKTTGPIKVFVDTKDNYADGMAAAAADITAKQMTPGIWFMPFAGNFRNPYFDTEIFAKDKNGEPYHDSLWSGTCIDSTHPKGEAFIRERTKRIYDWGYRYFKLDGLHTGMPSKNIYVNTSYKNSDFGEAQLHDPGTTLVEAYRKGLSVLREEAPDAFILGCNVSQNMRSMGASFGLLDAMRIGPDNGAAGRGKWNQVVLGAWHGTNLYFLNNRVWHNDPDPVYVRADNPIERAQWMISWLAVSGAMHTSSEQYDQLPPERLDLLKRCLPAHDLDARPVDLFESNRPRIWRVADERMDLIGLFNWSDTEPADITCSLDHLGLDPHRIYVGYDYWANKAIDPIEGELVQTLPPGTCRILALRAQEDFPQLVSTSRHITQGLIDVESEAWNARHRTLSGESHVVAGDLYELRIQLPDTGDWVAKRTDVDSKPIVEWVDDAHVLHINWTPTESATVSWSVRF